jgi:plasmid stabilization system protein ParE
MRVELSAFVQSDLEEIADYIAQDSPARALGFIRNIREKFAAIGKNPLIYRLRPEIGKDARMALVGRYVILFRIEDHVVRIERVVYGARDLPSIYGGAVVN